MAPGRGEIATIVVCEGDQATIDLLCEGLSADGFGVLPARTASDALRLCRHGRPDVLLLDTDLPGASGLDLMRQIREPGAGFDPSLPIILLTARGRPTGRARELVDGADDQVRKPYLHEELRARIQAVLRRGHRRHDAPVRVGEILIDPSRRTVRVGEREVHLSRREFTLLRVLASDPTRVFGKDELLRDVWGLRTPAGKTRTLDSHASRLRRKLDPEHQAYVVNCWGIGYRLVED